MTLLIISIVFIHRNSNTPTPVQAIPSRLSHSAAHSTLGDVHDIIEVDEEGDIENIESKADADAELLSNAATPNLIKKEELLSPNKEVGLTFDFSQKIFFVFSFRQLLLMQPMVSMNRCLRQEVD